MELVKKKDIGFLYICCLLKALAGIHLFGGLINAHRLTSEYASSMIFFGVATLLVSIEKLGRLLSCLTPVKIENKNINISILFFNLLMLISIGILTISVNYNNLALGCFSFLLAGYVQARSTIVFKTIVTSSEVNPNSFAVASTFGVGAGVVIFGALSYFFAPILALVFIIIFSLLFIMPVAFIKIQYNNLNSSTVNQTRAPSLPLKPVFLILFGAFITFAIQALANATTVFILKGQFKFDDFSTSLAQIPFLIGGLLPIIPAVNKFFNNIKPLILWVASQIVILIIISFLSIATPTLLYSLIFIMGLAVTAALSSQIRYILIKIPAFSREHVHRLVEVSSILGAGLISALSFFNFTKNSIYTFLIITIAIWICMSLLLKFKLPLINQGNHDAKQA